MIIRDDELFYIRVVEPLLSRSHCQNFHATEAGVGMGGGFEFFGALALLRRRGSEWTSRQLGFTGGHLLESLEDSFIAVEVRLFFLCLHHI